MGKNKPQEVERRDKVLVVPLMKEEDMAQLMEILEGTSLERRVGPNLCVNCDSGVGVSWCNASVPSVHLRMEITKD